MSAIIPPFDQLPKLPAQAVSKVIQEFDKQTDQLTNQVLEAVKEVLKVPDNATCNDPSVQKAKQDLDKIQQQINKIQTSIPKIQQTINQLKTVVQVSAAVKSAIAVAQLSNPVTAPLFIAQQLTAIQDATIVNAIESLKQFSEIPQQLSSKLASIVPPLLQSVQKISSVCGPNDTPVLELPNNVITDDYNDLVDTEFYTKQNVSQDDLDDRANTIETLIQEQRDLLTSLIEAPSQVYRLPGVPDSELGKSGDYYIDTQNQIIYGPKRLEGWGQGVNY